MSISEYKSIDDQSLTPNGDPMQPDLPLGAAIPNRLTNNMQFSLQNRLRRHAKTWDAARSTDTGATFENEGNVIIGHNGNFAGAANQTVPYTTGMQFSTHPACPLVVPFRFDLSPATRKIKVRVALTCQNAPGGMMAYGVYGVNDNRLMGLDANIEDFNAETHEPPPAGNFFTAEIRATDQYAEVGLTSVVGYLGMSYYELEIDLNRFRTGEPSTAPVNEITDATILLAFQSGYNAAAGTTTTLKAHGASTGISIEQPGNRIIHLADNFNKYVGIKDVGADHEVVVMTPKLVPPGESWHQVLATYTDDPAQSAYGGGVEEHLLIWPPIDPARIGIGSAAEGFATASTGTGIETGDTITRYPVSLFTLYSVTIQEEY